ncbi:hypothetical protein B0H14DRAFT_3902038 [Mycena olivaceomarginata]|nr:hypothetical protein B0H14DRAFT_3902038 [Mycena olivaceomarginata]
MLSTTHAIFRGLQQHLKTIIKELPADADPALKEGLVNAHRKLSDYFTKFDQSRYCTWAALLDPRISYDTLRDDYTDDDDLLAQLEASKLDLQSHFEIHYAPTAPDAPPTSIPQPTAGSPQKVGFTSHYKNAPGVWLATLRDHDRNHDHDHEYLHLILAHARAHVHIHARRTRILVRLLAGVLGSLGSLNLPGRVKGLAQYLNFMVNDAEVLALSPVWTSFLADIDYKIVQFCKSPSKAKFISAIRGKRCGYYGKNGASAIETEILAMLVVKEEQLSRTVCHTVEETLRAHTWNQFDGYDAGFDFRQFVTFVLTPFVATMLIQEDMGMVYSMNEANAIRRATSILDGGIQPIDTGISYSAHVMRASEAHALQRARSTFEDRDAAN